MLPAEYLEIHAEEQEEGEKYLIIMQVPEIK